MALLTSITPFSLLVVSSWPKKNSLLTRRSVYLYAQRPSLAAAIPDVTGLDAGPSRVAQVGKVCGFSLRTFPLCASNVWDRAPVHDRLTATFPLGFTYSKPGSSCPTVYTHTYSYTLHTDKFRQPLYENIPL